MNFMSKLIMHCFHASPRDIICITLGKVHRALSIRVDIRHHYSSNYGHSANGSHSVSLSKLLPRERQTQLESIHVFAFLPSTNYYLTASIAYAFHFLLFPLSDFFGFFLALAASRRSGWHVSVSFMLGFINVLGNSRWICSFVWRILSLC